MSEIDAAAMVLLSLRHHSPPRSAYSPPSALGYYHPETGSYQPPISPTRTTSIPQYHTVSSIYHPHQSASSGQSQSLSHSHSQSQSLVAPSTSPQSSMPPPPPPPPTSELSSIPQPISTSQNGSYKDSVTSPSRSLSGPLHPPHSQQKSSKKKRHSATYGEDGSMQLQWPPAENYEMMNHDGALPPFAVSSVPRSSPDTKVYRTTFVPGRDVIKLAPRPTRVMAPRKAFSCANCGRAFARREHLFRHIETMHHGQKDFKCDFCSRVFSRKDNMMQHIRNKHGRQPNGTPLTPAKSPKKSDSD